MRRSLGQLLFPAPCCLCDGALEDPLASPACGPCRGRFRALRDPACRKCGAFFAPGVAPGVCGECRRRPRPFRRAVSAARYQGVFQAAIVGLKLGRREVLAELLAPPTVLAYRRATAEPPAEQPGPPPAEGPLPPPAAVIPIPLPFWRGRRRGFNQAELIARPVARELGIPVLARVLRKRSRSTQTSLAPSARRANVRGAFRVRQLPPELAGQPLLLVDDVYTTGSTAEAAARCLSRAGAGPVDVLTAARTG